MNGTAICSTELYEPKRRNIVNTIFNDQRIMHLNSEIQDHRTMQLPMIHVYIHNVIHVSFVIEFSQRVMGAMLRRNAGKTHIAN